ncbi:MAG: hypothetical protein E7559_08880 [Ruminococcaceae bacterium]|nr:hypothetical protein [Oscillospiraceae bacterium]
MTSIVGIITIAVMLMLTAGLIVLQVYLSKMESKWPGLILPILSLVMALVAASGMYLFSAVRYDGTEIVTGHEEIIIETEIDEIEVEGIDEEEYEPEEIQEVNTSEAMGIGFGGVLLLFVLFSIPAAVYFIIYFCCRNAGKQKRALEEMALQDL